MVRLNLCASSPACGGGFGATGWTHPKKNESKQELRRRRPYWPPSVGNQLESGVSCIVGLELKRCVHVVGAGEGALVVLNRADGRRESVPWSRLPLTLPRKRPQAGEATKTDSIAGGRGRS